MKVGDLVVSKWLKPDRLNRLSSLDSIAIVIETSHEAVKLAFSDGRIKSSLISYWEVISES
jgi:hypothetical protein